MEEIYSPESFGASENFKLKEHFATFSPGLCPKVLNEEENKTQYLLSIKELMETENEITYHEMVQLSNSCSIDQLTCECENIESFPIELPEALTSNTRLPESFINLEDDTLEISKSLSKLESQKHVSRICIGSKRTAPQTFEFNKPPVPPDLTPGCDFIVTIFVYKPIAFNFFSSKNASERLRFSHEILILGRNTLEEFRDHIQCSADFGLCREVEDTSTDLRPLLDVYGQYPSSFLYIDDVFYNDFRHPKAIDYSIPVLEWAKEKNIKKLTSQSMKNVSVNSLTPRLGYPYVYMHLGDCEHLFVFADARLLDASDCLHSECYPHVSKITRTANRMCFLCSVTFAKWICVGSDRLPQHKVFLCTDCCNSYCYLDGQKWGNFKLYPYHERHVHI